MTNSAGSMKFVKPFEIRIEGNDVRIGEEGFTAGLEGSPACFNNRRTPRVVVATFGSSTPRLRVEAQRHAPNVVKKELSVRSEPRIAGRFSLH
jgi:hypothetical protein